MFVLPQGLESLPLALYCSQPPWPGAVRLDALWVQEE